MTPRQARIALAGFAMLAAGVAVNALYLQGEAAASRREAAAPRIADTRTRRADGADARREPRSDIKRAALHKPNSASVDAIAELAPAQGDTDTIRAIQRELGQRGYGALGSDGVMRPPLRAAIMAYEQANKLPVTGEASEALLKQLLLGPSVIAQAAGEAPQQPHADTVIKQVQRALAARGYRPGPADGRLNPETVAAIRTFEMDQGQVPTGRLSPEIMRRLGEGGGGAQAKVSAAR